MLLCASLSSVAACAFESGGVPGGAGSAASIGSASSGSEGGTGPDGTASASASSTAGNDPATGPDPDSTGPVAGESTGGTTGSLDPTGDPTGDPSGDPTGDPTGAAETGSTGAQETGVGSSDGGVVDDPYYGNCTDDGDCGPGTCFTTTVVDAPDAAVCLLPCGDGCPPPSDGEATPICTLSDSCALSCGAGIECPTGMDCYTFDSAQGDFYRCLWPQPA